MAAVGPTTSRNVERWAGNLLRIARADRGISVHDLAEAADVEVQVIERIESGEDQPSLPVLARILAAVDLELRITIDAYDDHDDVLDALDARLTPAEIAQRNRIQDDFWQRG